MMHFAVGVEGDLCMSDLIDRQDALRIKVRDCYDHDGILYVPLRDVIKHLKELPSAQKTGKWIFKNDLKQFFCSECGVPSLTYDDVYIYSMDLSNFCENCGARMENES